MENAPRLLVINALAVLSLLLSSSACTSEGDGGSDNERAQVTWRGLNTPCGTQLKSKDQQNPDYLYTGYEHDGDLNMFDAGARFYNPKLCQFASVDPIDHFTESSYAYVSNNPIRYTDPKGLDKKLREHRDKSGNLTLNEFYYSAKVYVTAGTVFTEGDLQQAVKRAREMWGKHGKAKQIRQELGAPAEFTFELTLVATQPKELPLRQFLPIEDEIWISDQAPRSLAQTDASIDLKRPTRIVIHPDFAKGEPANELDLIAKIAFPHEIGHAFGFGDFYELQRFKNVSVSRSGKSISLPMRGATAQGGHTIDVIIALRGHEQELMAGAYIAGDEIRVPNAAAMSEIIQLGRSLREKGATVQVQNP